MHASFIPRLTCILFWSAACFSLTRASTVFRAQRRYFVPLVMHGPNNQVNGIKETLALAEVLGDWVVVLPHLHSHQFTDNHTDAMRFTDLFDAKLIQSSKGAVMLDDLPWLLGPSWNRTLDAILLMVPGDKMSRTADLATPLGLVAPPPEHRFDSPVTSWLGCEDEQVQQLRRLLRPYRVVGVQTFHGLVFGSNSLAGPLLVPCPDRCCRAYQQTSPLIRKSALITDVARTFVKKRLRDRPFLAVHLRPYPDTCLKFWKPRLWTSENQAKIEKNCKNSYIMQRLVPSIKSLMQSYNVSTVFVMTHPLVRQPVRKLLVLAGIAPVFMELEDLQVAVRAHRSASRNTPGAEPPGLGASNTSFSLLAMVEEAVCAQARVFLGTKESSMTATIVQERLVSDLPPGDSYSFYRRAGYEQRPVAVDEFYRISNYSTSGSDRWRLKQLTGGVDVEGEDIDSGVDLEGGGQASAREDEEGRRRRRR